MKLFIEEYTRAHAWKDVVIAAREWILRDNIDNIIKDIRFLVRKGVHVLLVHNIPDNLWNRSFISAKIPDLWADFSIMRIPKSSDFYAQVLAVSGDVYKIIFLERQPLTSQKDGRRINTFSTNQFRSGWEEVWDIDFGVENTNYRNALETICQSIESGHVSRVHILPADVKSTIKSELFSLDGTWTLIWNDFSNPEILPSEEEHIWIIHWILQWNIQKGFLKERDKEYIESNRGNFFIATIDGIPVWCVEVKKVNDQTLELWALSVTHSFLSFKIWLALINFVESHAMREGKNLISLTNNEKLQSIYLKRWYRLASRGKYKNRRVQSPWVQVFEIMHEEVVKNVLESNPDILWEK